MPKSRIIVILGALIALLPLIGFPYAWEAFFQVLVGLSIVGLSVWSTIDKKLSLKVKAQMRQARKSADTDASAPPVVAYAKRVTDFYPKTGQPGRRKTDLRPHLLEDEPSSEETTY